MVPSLAQLRRSAVLVLACWVAVGRSLHAGDNYCDNGQNK